MQLIQRLLSRNLDNVQKLFNPVEVIITPSGDERYFQPNKTNVL